MQYRQGSLASTILAVQTFIAKHADRLGPIASSPAVERLNEIGVKLDHCGREQAQWGLAAQMATKRRAEARSALINEHMYPIAHVAEAEIDKYQELRALHMPRLNVNDKVLIESARAMASTALEFPSVFATGLADGHFVEALELAAGALVETLKERVDSIATREKATKGLASAYRVARLRIRVLDRLVTARIKNDAGLLTEWKRVKKVQRKPGAPRTVVTAEDEAPATPSAMSSATPLLVEEPHVERQAA